MQTCLLLAASLALGEENSLPKLMMYTISETKEKIPAATGKQAGDMYTHAKLAILSVFVPLYSTMVPKIRVKH